MGCDIHMYVEYQKTVNKITRWINGDYFKHNPYHKQYEDESQFSIIELHGDRNYTLFSTLAGVRDYSEKVAPIADPKGVPGDACEFVKSENERWEGDGHSHSWLTLKELKEYQLLNPVMHYTGLLAPNQLVELDKEGKTPDSWCQGTNQEGFERREWSEANESLVPLIEKLQARAKELMQYEWQDYDTANDEKIRIIFWFDN